MFREFDFWLLDRVYQPIVDRMADRTNGQAMASNCMVGVLVFCLTRLTLGFQRDTYTVSSVLLNIGVIAFALLTWASAVGYQSIVQQGIRNPLREGFYLLRFVCLWMIFPFACWKFAHAHNIMDTLLILELLLWIGSFYLVSCERRPPWRLAKHKVRTKR